MESTAARGRTARRRPLHTCGASVLATAHVLCKKAQEFDSPIGSTVKRITSLINLVLPLIYTMQYQWLISLSFIDDRIITVENIVEFVFPSSERLFNKIDDLVYTVECLPEKLDDVFNSFYVLIRRFPLLDWALVRLISWLTFLNNLLAHWGSKANAREKEIMIDINCNISESADCPSNGVESEEVQTTLSKLDTSEHGTKPFEDAHFSNQSPSFQSATSSPWSVSSQDEVNSSGEKDNSESTKSSYKEILESDNTKCSYKEILEKGAKENSENEVNGVNFNQGWEKGKEESIVEGKISQPFEASRP